MKSLTIVLALCVSVCFAELPGQLQSSHHSQHSHTVEDAKQQANRRMGGQFISNDNDRQFHQSSFEEVDTYGVGTLSSSAGLGIASNWGSMTGSLSSSYGSQHLNTGSPRYVAGGIGGRESSRSSQYVHSQSNTLPVVIPVVGGGVESFSEHEEQRVENSASPVGVTVVGGLGGSESFAHHNSQRRIQGQLSPVYTVPSGGSSESYVHHKEHRVESKPAPVFVAPSSGSEQYTQNHQRRIQNHITPMYVSQPAGSESYTQHEAHVVHNQAVPLVVATPSRASESYSHHREQRVQSQTSPIVTSPIGASDRYSHQRQQHVQSQSVPFVAAPATESESYSHRREEHIEQRPVSLHYTPSAGSESYAQMSKFSAIHPSPVVVQPYHGNSYNTHSQQYEHQSSRNQMPAVVYSTPSKNSHSAYSDVHSSNRISSSLVPIVTGGAVSSNSLLSENLSASGGTGAVVFPSIRTDSNFGHVGMGVSGSSSGLNHYMSESERLARTQAQGIGSSGVRTGSAQVDSSFDLSSGQSNVLAGVPVGSTGYRSKSWEKNSKWASETQFGPDGRTKNYNHLSTGESQQVDINGKRDGYKAATTTLDDDGKVSTYSIHT